MKYTLAALLILMTMVQPTGCDIEGMIKDYVGGTVDVPNAENRFEESVDERFDVIIENDEGGTVGGGLINGGNLIYGGEADEKEPEQPETVLAVLDKIDYKKPIIGYTMGPSGMVVDTENAGAYGNHVIRVPYIAGRDSDAINSINQKLYSSVEEYYNKLLNDKEGMNTYNVTYYGAANDKAVAIIQEISLGEQMIGGSTFYKAVYYDCKKDAEISFDDYISVMGYDDASFKEMLRGLKTKYQSLSETDIKNVSAVVIAEDATYVVVRFPDAIDPEPPEGMFTFGK